MTCIVAVIEDNKIYMGCDSFVGMYWTHLILPESESKIFTSSVPIIGREQEEPIIIGGAGDLRSCQLVKYNFSPPTYSIIEEKKDPTYVTKYIINQIIPHIKQIHTNHGSLKTKDGIQSCDSSSLIGWRNRLFCVYSDYGVVPSSLPYGAIGSGEELAYGSLKNDASSKQKPKDRIISALEVAEQHSNSVKSPFYLKEIECL